TTEVTNGTMKVSIGLQSALEMLSEEFVNHGIFIFAPINIVLYGLSMQSTIDTPRRRGFRWPSNLPNALLAAHPTSTAARNADIRLYSAQFQHEWVSDLRFPEVGGVSRIVVQVQEELPSFRSSNLTTLSIPFYDRLLPPDYFTNQQWHLPALRHLFINTTRWETVEALQSVKALIKEIGKELRSLYLPRTNKGFDLSADIWSSCPNLELLHTSAPLLLPPPLGHPFHILSISSLRLYDEIPLKRYIPDWPAIRTVRMNTKWDGALESSKLELFRPGLRLEDACGELYADYLARSNGVVK
ncbi:9748_t:CDS:2, partial [Acaulospora colombiana]